MHDCIEEQGAFLVSLLFVSSWAIKSLKRGLNGTLKYGVQDFPNIVQRITLEFALQFTHKTGSLGLTHCKVCWKPHNHQLYFTLKPFLLFLILVLVIFGLCKCFACNVLCHIKVTGFSYIDSCSNDVLWSYCYVV